MKISKIEIEDRIKTVMVNHILPANDMDAKITGWEILIDHGQFKIVINYLDCEKAMTQYVINLGVVC